MNLNRVNLPHFDVPDTSDTKATYYFDFALIKNTIMIDFLFKFFTVLEDHSIHVLVRNANNTQTDRTVTVWGLSLCSTNNKRKKLSSVAQDLNILYTYRTFFSRMLNFKLR